MAWLSDITDKVEDLLNKIDKNSATVLNSDYWKRYDNNIITKSSLENSKQFTHEDNFLEYLNTSSKGVTNTAIESELSSPISSLLMDRSTNNVDPRLQSSTQSNESNPENSSTSTNAIDTENYNLENDLQIRNVHLRNQMHRYQDNAFHTQMLQRTADNDHTLEAVEPKYSYDSKLQLLETDELMISPDSLLKSSSETLTDHQKQIIVLSNKLQSLRTTNVQILKEMADLQTALSRSRLELLSTRSELEQHKARAFRILQDKEKLIAELRRSEFAGIDDATLVELKQLRQERDLLREENQQTHEQLRTVRDELNVSDLTLEKMRQRYNEVNLKFQESLASERQRRQDAEEIARLHSEEIRSLKDEMINQQNNYTIQIQKQDAEISRLRLQVSATSTPNSEVESRLAALTQTLVLKQQALENITTERNALRLQFEKLEHEFRTIIRNSNRNVTYSNTNDNDDIKTQVPMFLMETPFDTGVTRRVKRAYSSLDAISIRTGVFLRRYPLARILVLIYMALLQFWVLVVLFSQSPEVH
ncbi:PREDICTED: golgin-84-like isoform X1 [Polistes dominula]|uniref:Golgin-84-like isoform X1 n=2 Tax=Polistes dominula TaxID=743375 RepID=A0ABM1IFN2_POLDO|nr:PREDICTED: golgin-84-like isoform X1 [Polistes dominula]XP_015179019.1 PREDICTED: golgin-84-like isoform X1 [Polistes dominula]XP_015179020.1 PREDICTED: golgin-84-like isoform X1 [Polistes dominula]XP_015179021.1 PREDICTED: golgin-84-like isoform X1 [Polistes dominula]